MFHFSYIDPPVRLTDVGLLAVSALNFIDSFVFQVTIRFGSGLNVPNFLWAVNIASILCLFSIFSILSVITFT